MPHNLGYVTIKAARVISPQRRKSTHGSTKLTTSGFFITAHPELSRRTRPPRLGGECPSCFSPRRRRGSQRDLLLQRRNSTISIQHLQRSITASMTRDSFAPDALPDFLGE